jgi:osmotically-inducible protein OsmY
MKYVMTAVSLAVALSACTASQQQQAQSGADNIASSAPAGAKDAYLVAAVGTKLATVNVDSTTNVKVSASNGAVTLAGQARTATERERYETAARSVSGVLNVTDDIAVNPRARGLKEQSSDALLTAKVASAIAGQAGLNVFHISTSSKGGIVTLAGTVPTHAVEQTVLQTARGVSGVRGVVNQLDVQK